VLGRLFLLFTLVPLAELYLLITLGGWMGVGPTVALVAVTGMAGAWLARREGRKALASYREAIQNAQLPEDGIVSGLLILAGGVMLITPGVLTDLFGISMMIPPVRRAAAKLVKARLQKRLGASVADGSIRVVSAGVGPGAGFPGFGGAGFEGSGFGGDGPGTGEVGEVIDAEVVDHVQGHPHTPSRPTKVLRL